MTAGCHIINIGLCRHVCVCVCVMDLPCCCRFAFLPHHRVKQDLYAAMSAKQSALQLLQEREQQLSAVSSTANTCKQQLEHLQRSEALLGYKRGPWACKNLLLTS